MSESIELSLSPKYVTDWGLLESVREILQNAIDCEADGYESRVSYNDGVLTIETIGKILEKSTLIMGESGKSDSRYIGKYGEGYKLALLVLTREGHGVRIYTGNELWNPCFKMSETFGCETLHMEISDNDSGICDCVAFEIDGIKQSDMNNLSKSFPVLARKLGKEIGGTLDTEYGTVLLDDDYSGMFFVNGLFVDNDTEFRYGYDFKSEYVELDRDRRSINYYRLKELTAKALTQCGDTSIVVGGIRERIVDLEDHVTVLEMISEEQSVDFKHYYYKEHCLPDDAFVGTPGMFPFVTGRHLHEDNEIVSRIIARGNGEEDKFDELKEKARDLKGVENAIARFDTSDYKKLLVWMNRQKRLTKSSRKEFREIIDGSRDLRFSGFEIISDRIDSLVEEEMLQGDDSQ